MGESRKFLLKCPLMLNPSLVEDIDFFAELLQIPSSTIKSSFVEFVAIAPPETPPGAIEEFVSRALDRLRQYAPPLMPLKDRDLEALVSTFEQEDIQEIESDIALNLQTRLPEPCWEDNPIEFLQDFL